MSNKKVLLVDDDPNILSAYRRLLRKKFHLVTAESGAEGIAILEKQGPFAVVVTDFRMPGMNGVEFLSAARQISPDSIRIMLSGQADMQVTINAINEGKVSYFLTKPCPSQHLIRTLMEAVEQYEVITSERVKLEGENLHKAIHGTVQAIVSMIERRDPYTAYHQERVKRLAGAIAREMGLSGEQTEILVLAASIHDLGKIYVPAEILTKPGHITDLERALIKTHPQVGYDILKTIEFPGLVSQIVQQHHERLNGSGYPLHLSGSQILIEARILGVADVVESLASHRPYRPAFTIDEALAEIRKNRGILYDPEVVDACLRVFQKGFTFD